MFRCFLKHTVRITECQATKITFEDLERFEKWLFSGINKNGDFCGASVRAVSARAAEAKTAAEAETLAAAVSDQHEQPSGRNREEGNPMKERIWPANLTADLAKLLVYTFFNFS